VQLLVGLSRWGDHFLAVVASAARILGSCSCVFSCRLVVLSSAEVDTGVCV